MHMCMHVCMNAYMHACIHVCMGASMYKCMNEITIEFIIPYSWMKHFDGNNQGRYHYAQQ